MNPSPSRDHAAWPTAAATNPPPSARFPGEDAGYSLAEMARRDLDAALQLLVDRAQYITGATGAAIALRRTGRNDMQCRASTGSNAPELGALLSTEFGLSGESVRTRQALRCDDAERDARVNREVCRHLGIASVVVMPVVNDDGVLGVFELFSGEVNAFGERDLSAVQRLSEMVETAVRMAEATEKLPEKLKASEIIWPEGASADAEEDKILDAPALEAVASSKLVSEDTTIEELVLEDAVLEEAKPAVKAVAVAETAELSGSASGLVASAPPEPENLAAKTAGIVVSSSLPASSPAIVSTSEAGPKIASLPTVTEGTLSAKPSQDVSPVGATSSAAQAEAPKIALPEKVLEKAVAAPAVTPPAEPETPRSVEPATAKKALFWSAAPNPAGDTVSPEDSDQSHVPPVLRGLRKCEACGFPVSSGRALCVECEDKKWRGQLKGTQGQSRPVAGAAASPLAAPKQEGRVLAAAAPAGLASAAVPAAQSALSATIPTVAAADKELKTSEPATSALLTNSIAIQTAAVPLPSDAGEVSPDFVLSAGLGSSQSWFSANKYILIALLLVGVVVAGFLILR